MRNIVGLGEVSAAGSPGETGVILLEVPDPSDAAKAGLFAGDVLLAFNGKPIKELKDLLQDKMLPGRPRASRYSAFSRSLQS